MTGRVLRKIARKELTEALRDGRVRILAGTVLMLLFAGLAASWHTTSEARKAVEAARAAEQKTWLEQGNKNPHSAAHFGQYAFKPRPPLSTLDRGVDAYLGTAVWLEAHWQDPFSLRPAEDRTAVQRFGELTAAFTLQVLAPLLVIVMGFAALAGERERGTLRMLGSLGLSPQTLILGKATGLGGALAVVLAPALLLGVAVAWGTAPMAGSSAFLGAPLLALVHVAYLGAWLAIVLLVSSRARTGRGALVVLLGFWMLTTIVVPRCAADLAERLHPVPSPNVFYEGIAEDSAQGVDGHGSAAERRQALEARVLAEYDAETLEQLPVNFAGLSLQASEEHSNLVFDRHYSELWRLYEQQERVQLWTSLVSPMLSVRSLSMALAGTDVAHHRHFAQAAEIHRRSLVKFLNDDMTHNAGNASFGYLASESLWREAPTFVYRSPALAEVLAGRWPALLSLTLWLVGSTALAWRASRTLRWLVEGKA